MPRKKPVIAICYDYDGTLIRGNMQENSFIPELQMQSGDFWKEVKKHAKDNDMDEVLSYMHLMVKKCQEQDLAITKQALRQHGQEVELFPGVQNWFNEIDEYAKEKNVKIEHYVISSGVDEMIRGSSIARHFDYIFASGFLFDANGAPAFAARSINYTTKTQYLFRINKGIKNSWDNTKINKYVPMEERPIPFSQMIYIGDGDTDVPAMKMLDYQGGYSLAVYPPKSGQRMTKKESDKKKNTEELVKLNRAQYCAEADYSKDKDVYKIITSIIDCISQEIFLQNYQPKKS